MKTEHEIKQSEPRKDKTQQNYERMMQYERTMREHDQIVGNEREQMIREHHKMMCEHHKKMLWVHFTNMTLGLWLVASPFTFGYRSPAMMWSDMISGILVIVLSALSLSPPERRGWPRWANCFVGIWLLFAPLVFWSPDASACINDTLIGSLVISFAILIPGMPKMDEMAMMVSGQDIPPGWTYNPSSWLQRTPAIALAIISFFISRYLAAFQLGYIDNIWDPFFGEGTRKILTSEVSRAWPVSDAGLGALTYMLEALSGFMGDQRRWRTMPWMVLMFGFLVIPLGVTSIVLVILQPVAVGTWCTFCLLTAIFMLIMIPTAVDEVVAMLQFLLQSRREGKSLWYTFWMGGTAQGSREDKRYPRFDSTPLQKAPAMFWGITVPWTLLLSAALGIWLMFAPSVFQTSGATADNDHLVGALVVTFAVIAMAEVTRAARFINALFGLWIFAASWLISGVVTGNKWNGVITGVLLILLSLPRGRVKETYSSWDRFVV
jgi:hypothetical protein